MTSASLVIAEAGNKWSVPLGLCRSFSGVGPGGPVSVCEPALGKAVTAGSQLGARGTCCIRTCPEECEGQDLLQSQADSPCSADGEETRLQVASSYGLVAGVDQRVSHVLLRLSACGSVSYQACSARAVRGLCFNSAGASQGAAESCFSLQLSVLLYLQNTWFAVSVCLAL